MAKSKQSLNVLFVCSMARLRSKTAAHCIGAGSDYAGTDKDADKPVTVDDIKKADLIVCMESRHRSKIRRKVKGVSKKIIVWDIQDIYEYMDDTLVAIIKSKYETQVYNRMDKWLNLNQLEG